MLYDDFMGVMMRPSLRDWKPDFVARRMAKPQQPAHRHAAKLRRPRRTEFRHRPGFFCELSGHRRNKNS